MLYDFYLHPAKPGENVVVKPGSETEPPCIFFKEKKGFLEAMINIEQNGEKFVLVMDNHNKASQPALICCYNRYLAQNFSKHIPLSSGEKAEFGTVTFNAKERDEFIEHAYEKGYEWLMIITGIEQPDTKIKFALMKIRDWLKKRKFTTIEGVNRVESPE